MAQKIKINWSMVVSVIVASAIFFVLTSFLTKKKVDESGNVSISFNNPLGKKAA